MHRAQRVSQYGCVCPVPDNKGTKDFAVEKNTKAPEGTGSRATTGSLIDGLLGWLVGVGALAIPGVGRFVAAGPKVAALAGAGAGGAVGGIAGAVIGMGIPEYEAKRYEGRIKEGGSCSLCTLRRPKLDNKSERNPGPNWRASRRFDRRDCGRLAEKR